MTVTAKRAVESASKLRPLEALYEVPGVVYLAATPVTKLRIVFAFVLK